MTGGATGFAEEAFLALPRTEREVIISHGAAIRLSGLRKRQFLAQSKVRNFEAKYRTTLAKLDCVGLPDDADFEMHEDFVMWHHWQEVSEALNHDISALETIADQGLRYSVESGDVSD